MSQHQSSRRNFLRSALLSTSVLGAGQSLTANETRKAAANKGTAKNIIMMVSDGMGMGTLSLAHSYRGVLQDRLPHWEGLYRKAPVVRAMVETFSANNIVTDSAAAASAWGGGQRVNNGVLNISPDGKPNTPIQQKLKKAGKKVGLVSTASITHATPAGFAANQSSRADEAEIAKQYLEREVDVLLGGGLKFFSPELQAQFASKNYQILKNRDELLSTKPQAGKRVLGLFSESYIPYEVDRMNLVDLAAVTPTLAEMSKRAIDELKDSPDGFFLMIEGARIDHACHGNDTMAAIQEQLAFDDAIGAVLQFVEKNPDTLLIITTDHGTGGAQMNGVSAKTNQAMAPGIYDMSSQVFHNISRFNRSFEWLRSNGVNGLSGKSLQDALLQYTGINFKEDEIKKLQGLKLNHLLNNELFQPYTGVGWTSNNHTSELVEFCAFGPGSCEFPAWQQNYQIHNKLLKILGIA